MDRKTDKNILDLAVERGLVTEEQVAQLYTELSGELPTESTEATGASQTTVFWRTQAEDDDSSTPSVLPDSWQSMSETLDAAPVENWDRYQLGELLGAGGMGRVYKAWDPRLQRHVALKFIARDDPQVMQRFVREARAQAQVEHAHVCRVYEVGEVAGQPYIAMQLVEGWAIDEAREKMSLEHRVLVAIDAAEGIHAAHRQGLIHRDLKPSNILVSRRDDGRWEPTILDFGLARELSDAALTATGIPVGTPSYMAPEQARGDSSALDRRTDVWGLGATLYELFSGQPPFSGSGPIEIVFQVLNNDVPTIRDVAPELPADLATIVMFCLQREPQRRYDSARALADDLRRYRDGEPIQARPPGVAYLAGKWLRRNRKLAALLSVALLITGLLLGLLVHQRLGERERAVAAQKFGQDVAQIDGLMWRSRTIPLHDTLPQKQLVREQMRQIEEQMEELGSMADGPGYFAIGSGHLVLFEYDDARDYLQQSWDAGYQTPEVAYGLALSYGEAYEHQRMAALGIGDHALREARLREVEAAFREPALRWLRASEGVESASPHYVSALIAVHEERNDDALAQVEQAIEGRPWLYEAYLLQGRAYAAIGSEQAFADQPEQADEAFGIAEQALRQALAIAPSDPRVGEQMAVLKIQRWTSRRGRSDDFAGLLEALAQLDAAAVADSERADGYSVRSRVHFIWSQALEADGGDPLPQISKAIDAANQALALDPHAAQPHFRLGEAYTNRGLYLLRRGKDPRRSLELGIASLLTAESIQPSAFGQFWIGEACRILAEYQHDNGYDPRDNLNRATEYAQRSIDIDPTLARGYFTLASAQHLLGKDARQRGEDPTAYYQRAIDTFETGMQYEPNGYLIPNDLGNTYGNLARAQMAAGGDPRDALQAAGDAYSRCSELRPRWAFPYSNKADALIIKAQYSLHHGGDPTPDLQLALPALERALELRPHFAEAHLNRGLAHGLAAEYAYRRGEDPTLHVEQSLAAFEAGLKMRPEFSVVRPDMARAACVQARFLLEQGRSPETTLSAAQRTLAPALTDGPDPASALLLAGVITLHRARWSALQGMDPEPLLDAAGASLIEATQHNARLAEAHQTAAEVALLRADWQLGQGNKAAVLEALDAGLVAVEEALAIQPDLALALAIRGGLQLLQARAADDPASRKQHAAEAAASLDAAVTIDVNLSRMLATDRQRAELLSGG